MPTTDEHYAGIVRAFDELAADDARWSRRTRGYHELIKAVHQSIVRPGASVLEIGSGNGDLLAALAPRAGVGVDVSAGMVELARTRHPGLEFEAAAGEDARARRDVRLHRPLRPAAVRRRPARALPQRRARTRTATRGSSSTPTASSGGPRSRCSSCCA